MQDRAVEKEKQIEELSQKLEALQKQFQKLESKLETPLNIPLFDFAKTGDIDRISHLLDCGASVNAIDEEGFTPLHRAVLNNHLLAARYLADKGANWSALNQDGHTILHVLCLRQEFDILNEVLHDYYPKLHIHSTLIEIYDLATDEVAKLSIANFMLMVGVKQDMGDECKQLEYVKNALSKNANINVQDESKSSSLHNAAYLGKTEIVRFLLENGCDTELQDKYGRTAIEVANQNKIAIASLILNYTLLNAVQKQDMDTFDRILLTNVDLNEAKNVQGMTPLHLAVLQGNVEMVAKLLQKGASPKIVNMDGDTPLDIAARSGDKSSIKLILKADAHFNKGEISDASDKIHPQFNKLANYMNYKFGAENTLRVSQCNSTTFANTRIQKALLKMNGCEQEKVNTPKCK